MKHYVASNAATGCWWNGKAFSDEGPIAVITAPELAVLRATYENVMATEVVSLPTITEEEFEEQEKASVLFANAVRIDKAYTKRLEEAIKHFEEKAEAKYWRDAYNRLSDQREEDTDA
jgi:predicted nucleic acid-binding protein